MKKIISALAVLCSIGHLSSQVLRPVKWTTEYKKTADCEYDIILKASIDKGWHLYSSFLDPNIGPVPTTVEMKTDGNSSVIGKLSESTPIKEIEAVWDNKEVSFFANSAWFKRKVKLKNGNASTIIINVNWIVCNDGTCMPPDDKELSVTIPADPSCNPTKVEDTKTGSIDPKNNPAEVKTAPEVKENTTVAAIDTTTKVEPISTNNTDTAKNEKANNLPPANSTATEQKPESGWGYFSGGFLAGLLALLTPCVFPMIPMTMSFFLKQSKSKAAGKRNALFYALSIILIYTGLGLLITSIFGGDALYNLSSSIWFNLAFFVILLVFAISFLGAFEITLPNSFVNKVDAMGDKGGIVGIFFMALALAVVSFSCTGPILGSAIGFAAKSGNSLNAMLIFFGFSLGLAIPFALFAFFPSMLQNLPKSGGWLNTVKVVLGFLELAFAFKFASNADLVLQSHWLTREVFLAIWIGVFGLLSIYLLGWFRLPHDDQKTEKLSVGRVLFASLTLAFTIYMIPGMWGAPLKILSGLTPPSTYAEAPNGFHANITATANGSATIEEGMELGPHGLTIYKDYDLALAHAKKVNKPLMVDYTGYSCANCRLMEDNVWSNPEILALLKNDVVLVSLYEDEKIELPEAEQKEVMIDGDKKKINTIGKKWINMQYTRYGLIAQPYYAILDHNEKDLIKAVGYTPKVEDYKNWILSGIAAFKNTK